MTPPLDGVRILDLSSGIAGSYCTKLLGDYGARVIKVESPRGGDSTRAIGPFPQDIPNIEASGLFLFLNTGKEGITLDVDSDTGKFMMGQMANQFDVIVESFGPDRSETLRAQFDHLAMENPRLVVTSLTDFATDDPSRHDKMTDLLAFAITGFMYPMGEPDMPPVGPGGPFTGFITGLMACFGTLMAYLNSVTKGYGQRVEVSTIETILSSLIYDVTRYSYTATPRQRAGRLYSGASGGIRLSLQPTKDGHIGFLVGPGYERWRLLWETLLEAPEILEDERFSTPEGQALHHDELESKAQEWLLEHNSEEIFHMGQSLRLLFGQILTMKDIFHNEHLRARDYFVSVKHPVAGELDLPGMPWRFSETTSEKLRPAPTLGQDNLGVYSEFLGLTKGDLVQLRGNGAI